MGVVTQQHYTLNEPAVAGQLIDGETILIHFDQGRYYSASGLGSELLQLLLSQQPPEKLVDLLVAQYSLEPNVAAESVVRYVDTLLSESLIVPDARPRPPGNELLDVRFASTAFEPPVLEMHAELEDLLRLDPLHDVDDTGWPSAAADRREQG